VVWPEVVALEAWRLEAVWGSVAGLVGVVVACWGARVVAAWRLARAGWVEVMVGVVVGWVEALWQPTGQWWHWSSAHSPWLC
jgi:hypothetical protein